MRSRRKSNHQLRPLLQLTVARVQSQWRQRVDSGPNDDSYGSGSPFSPPPPTGRARRLSSGVLHAANGVVVFRLLIFCARRRSQRRTPLAGGIDPKQSHVRDDAIDFRVMLRSPCPSVSCLSRCRLLPADSLPTACGSGDWTVKARAPRSSTHVLASWPPCPRARGEGLVIGGDRARRVGRQMGTRTSARLRKMWSRIHVTLSDV